MESIIRWKTGIPKEEGWYIVTKSDGIVKLTRFRPSFEFDIAFFKEFIIAWCKLSEIEPYKEEEE